MVRETRIYVVPAEPNGGKFGKQYLVEATHPALAEKHVKGKYVGTARPATAKDVNDLRDGGVKVETAAVEV